VSRETSPSDILFSAVKYYLVCERKAVSEQRRELCAFCSQCWKFANFRTNKNVVGDGQFMEELGVFQERQARSCDGGLRGELTEGEWKAYIKTRLRNNKAPGPAPHQSAYCLYLLKLAVSPLLHTLACRSAHISCIQPTWLEMLMA